MKENIVKTTENKKTWEININFMRLVGSNGVLPPHYTEKTINQLRKKNRALQDFYDIFHHHLIRLFYDVWVKNKCVLQYEDYKAHSKTTDDFTQTLLALSGINNEALSIESIAYYASIFANSTRSTANLKILLSGYFKVPVEINEFQSEWISLQPESFSYLPSFKNKNGNNALLGMNATIGTRVFYCQRKINVIIGPLDNDQFSQFMLGKKVLSALQQFIQTYVGENVIFDIQPILSSKAIKSCRLNHYDSAQLGLNSWVYSEDPTDKNDVTYTSTNIPPASREELSS